MDRIFEDITTVNRNVREEEGYAADKSISRQGLIAM